MEVDDAIINTRSELKSPAAAADSLRVTTRSAVIRRLVIAATIGVVSVVALVPICQGWLSYQVRARVYTGIDEVPFREIAIIPGVGRANVGRPGHGLLPRLRMGLALYRAHKVESILISGVGSGSATDEVVEMRRWLKARGVPDAHIISDPAGHRTFDTVRRAADLLHVRGAIFCTQAPSVNRSVFLARAVGIDAVGLVVPSRPFPIHSWRQESLKAVLAVLDIYVLDRRPRETTAGGIIDGRRPLIARSE